MNSTFVFACLLFLSVGVHSLAPSLFSFLIASCSHLDMQHPFRKLAFLAFLHPFCLDGLPSVKACIMCVGFSSDASESI